MTVTGIPTTRVRARPDDISRNRKLGVAAGDQRCGNEKGTINLGQHHCACKVIQGSLKDWIKEDNDALLRGSHLGK